MYQLKIKLQANKIKLRLKQIADLAKKKLKKWKMMPLSMQMKTVKLESL